MHSRFENPILKPVLNPETKEAYSGSCGLGRKERLANVTATSHRLLSARVRR